jgi:hypothetical protein
MKSLAFPLIALALAYLVFFGYLAASYGELPERIASHFDFSGHANGWMSRGVCTGLMAATAVSFINLPHKAYWLAPERRAFALGVLLRYAIWFASATVLFLAGIQWLVVRANLSSIKAMDMTMFAGMLALFLFVTGIWTWRIVRQFSQIPS